MITVAAVDDHEGLIYGVRAYLADEAQGITFVGEYRSVAAFCAGADPVPDVVLLDMLLPGEPDIAANVRAVCAAGARVALHTSDHRSALVGKAVAAGAKALVLKDDPLPRLAEAVRQVAAGRFYWSSRLAHALTDDPRAKLRFTPRELSTLTLLAKGLPRRVVARKLNISEATMRTYLDRAVSRYAEVGVLVSGSAEVVAAMLEDGHVVIDPVVPAEADHRDEPEAAGESAQGRA